MRKRVFIKCNKNKLLFLIEVFSEDLYHQIAIFSVSEYKTPTPALQLINGLSTLSCQCQVHRERKLPNRNRSLNVFRPTCCGLSAPILCFHRINCSATAKKKSGTGEMLRRSLHSKRSWASSREEIILSDQLPLTRRCIKFGERIVKAKRSRAIGCA